MFEAAALGEERRHDWTLAVGLVFTNVRPENLELSKASEEDPYTGICPATPVTAPMVVLATSFLLNESQRKMVTVGLSTFSHKPILRISSPQKRHQVVDLNSDEAAQVSRQGEEWGSVHVLRPERTLALRHDEARRVE